MPFSPKYTITGKILNNLTTIASGCEFIEQARLTPKLEAKLRQRHYCAVLMRQRPWLGIN